MPPIATVAIALRQPLNPVTLRGILSMAYPHPAMWFGGIALFLVNCVWLALSAKMSVEPKWFLTTIGLVAGGSAIAAARISAPHLLPESLIRPLRYVLTVLAAGVLLNNLRVFNALAMTTPFPLADATLHGWDEALGFDWLAYGKLALASPLAGKALFYFYNELTFKMPAVILAIAVINDAHKRVMEIGYLVTVTAIISVIVAAGFPALTPLYTLADTEFNGLLSRVVGNMSFLPVFHEQLAALRAPGPVHLVPAAIQGLSSFPSFHTAMAIIIAWSCRGPWWTTAIGIFSGLAIIVATPVFGSHYMVDLVAGAVLCVAAILTWRFYVAGFAKKFAVL